jgi:hypothetical protein
MSKTVTVILIHYRHKPIDLICSGKLINIYLDYFHIWSYSIVTFNALQQLVNVSIITYYCCKGK